MDQINENAGPLSMNLRIGGLYDSKVVTDEIDDQNSADEGLSLNLDAGWQKSVTRSFGFRLRYNNHSVFYNDLDEYDLIDQAATLEGQWVTGRFIFSIPVGYNYILEDGHSDSRRITLTPTCMMLFAEGRQAVVIYGVYADIEDKDGIVPDEGGISSGGGLAYVFQREDKMRLSLSLAYQSTKYDSAILDYDACALPVNRRDKAAVANAGFYFPLSSRLGLYADYTFLHNNSNVQAYDYDRHIIEGGLAVNVF
jgi:hypothetical protein